MLSTDSISFHPVQANRARIPNSTKSLEPSFAFYPSKGADRTVSKAVNNTVIQTVGKPQPIRASMKARTIPQQERVTTKEWDTVLMQYVEATEEAAVA